MKVAVIAGSGLSSVTERIEGERRLWTHPGLDRPPAPGHRMEVVEGSLGGVPALGFGGRLHFYQGYSMAEVAEPVAQAHDWGAEVLFVTNATGSLRAELASGEIALIRDHVNLMGDNPLRGAPSYPRGTPAPSYPRGTPALEFLDLSQAYDPALRHAARAAGRRMGLRLPEVVYVGVAGPSFETPAEVRMLRMLGGDVAGMSSVPEVIMARRLGMRVLGVTVIANRAGAPATAEDVLLASQARAAEVGDLLEAVAAGLA
ncbi:MAG TPA: purine-nucleoside phosphorylase [Actinomycetota bacterium]|nr:purine-nucleoside phosphorylase [Actinomycetota bacterium]